MTAFLCGYLQMNETRVVLVALGMRPCILRLGLTVCRILTTQVVTLIWLVEQEINILTDEAELMQCAPHVDLRDMEG